MEKVTRRDFIVTTTTAAAGACLCGLTGCLPLSLYGNTPEIQPAAYGIQKSGKKTEIIIDTRNIPDLLNEGKAYKIIDPQLTDSLIIANTGDDHFTALSISCTHNGFEVEYQPEKKRFRCISINHAEFSLDGKVIGDGPTAKALTSYPIHRQDDKLMIRFA
ncbi:MAG: twin-arginine translocation signal domain-containing protein [Pseudomonadota bacterium]